MHLYGLRNRGGELLEHFERSEKIYDYQGGYESLRKRAKRLGVDMNYIVTTGYDGDTTEHDADTKMIGASLGKLPLGMMAIEQLEPHEVITIVEDMIRDGGGHFDNPPYERTGTTNQLVRDMLKYSGNTAVAVLAEKLGGPDAINEFYDEQGWIDTRVERAPNGLTALATTTPREVLLQMNALLSTDLNPELADVARRSLIAQGFSAHGICRVMKDDPDLSVFNKTGELNPDRDDPYVLRHDAGVVMGPNGRVGYVVMTSSPESSRLRTELAKWTGDTLVGQFGAEVLEQAGGNSDRQLGALTLRVAR